MGTMTAGLPLPAQTGKCPTSLTALPRKTVPLAVNANRGRGFLMGLRQPVRSSVTQMLFASRFCQHDLVLALPEARPVFIGTGFVAMHT